MNHKRDKEKTKDKGWFRNCFHQKCTDVNKKLIWESRALYNILMSKVSELSQGRLPKIYEQR